MVGVRVENVLRRMMSASEKASEAWTESEVKNMITQLVDDTVIFQDRRLLYPTSMGALVLESVDLSELEEQRAEEKEEAVREEAQKRREKWKDRWWRLWGWR